MRKIVSLIAGMLLCASTAFAQPFWTGSVFNGDPSVSGFVPGIQTFDWSSSGSGLATGLGPAGTPLVAGTPFNFLYQASLVNVTAPGGGTVAFPGLNTTFEYTVVAKIPEVVLSPAVAIPGTNLLASTTGGTFAIYYDSVNANTLAGTGFNNGILVASGSINPGQITAFTVLAADGTGIGSTTLEGLVSYSNPLYLDPALEIIDFRFEGTLNYPPLESTTASFFDGNNGFAITAVTGNDILFKVDGSSKFSVVPEPSTLLLMGAGLLGVAGFTRKRMKN